MLTVTAVDPDAPLVTSTHTRPAEHPFQLVLEGCPTRRGMFF